MKHHSKSGSRMGLLAKVTGASGITVLCLLVAIIVFSIISVRSVSTLSMETAVIMGKDKLMSDMIHFEEMISQEYGQLSLQDGKLVGEQGVSMEYQYDFIDKFCSGAGIVATVFIGDGDDYRRVTTNIVNDAGERAVNTLLGTGSAAYPSVHSGRDYKGNAVILGRDYLTHYRPIFASDNRNVIGILFIGIELTKIQQIISQNTADHVRIIIIIALTILLALIIVNTLSLNLMFVKPIRTITAIIGKLSTGDINQQINESKNNDEIGTMKNELKHLIDGLKRTADFAQNIGKGTLDAEYQPLSSKDILGNSLLEMRHSLQNAEKEHEIRTREEAQRSWGTSGLAKFAEILRHDNDNLETLSYQIISNLVKYTEANQGGIFVLNDADNEDDKLLEMKACYAFDRKKFMEQQIRPGEGLVGTCYLEGEAIYMTSVPDEYISITSGLGDANPNAILICPLKVNDLIYGVIELASFREFEPYQIEFVQKICESIASTIGSVKVNIRTSQLLMQSKLQAEEMANQEEELRQNMEEMQATQEEMRRREAELEGVLEKSQKSEKRFKEKTHWYEALLDAFEETPISVTDMNKNITFLNKAALTILGTTREATMGKYCGDVWNVDICKDERCGIECLKCNKGKSEFQVGDITFTTLASYIKDSEGNNIGHIEVVDNITESRNRETELQKVLATSQKSEKEFREKVHWYEALLDAFEETPISVTDMNKNVTFLNKSALSILGTTREATMGRYCGDVWNVDICKDKRCGIECLKCNKGKSEFQVGDVIFTTLASYIKDSEGNNIGHIEVVDNITKIANKDFEMQQFYNAIFETNSVVEFGSDAIINTVNQNFLNLWQTDRSTFVGKHLSAFVGEEAFNEIKTTVRKGKIFDEVLKMDVNGNQILCHLTFVPINDRQGELQRVLLLADIEE